MQRAAYYLFNALRHSKHASPRTRLMLARAIALYRALVRFHHAIGA